MKIESPIEVIENLVILPFPENPVEGRMVRVANQTVAAVPHRLKASGVEVPGVTIYTSRADNSYCYSLSQQGETVDRLLRALVMLKVISRQDYQIHKAAVKQHRNESDTRNQAVYILKSLKQHPGIRLTKAQHQRLEADAARRVE